VIHTRNDLRPVPTYPVYPPYHIGDYIEDFFYKKFIEESPTVARDYIALSWTTLYCQNQDPKIQNFLNSLDQSKSYFTVCQHDDAPRHSLPPNTLCFSAGGNVSGPNIIPIPLICSELSKELILKEEKQYTASFVGSDTHPIRIKMAQALFGKSDYQIWLKTWSPSVDKPDFKLFLELASKSKYMLCPRGYGLNSFRLYEAFQLNCVPVIITDKSYLPWQDELNWSEFSILIDETNLPHIDQILKNIDDVQYKKLLTTGKNLYSSYFTLNGMYDNIIKRLK
tara:strand:+ start:1342 stop:2184 length:843 start_codon:yes stop_codon:yes gene_type:complete